MNMKKHLKRLTALLYNGLRGVRRVQTVNEFMRLADGKTWRETVLDIGNLDVLLTGVW